MTELYAKIVPKMWVKIRSWHEMDSWNSEGNCMWCHFRHYRWLRL